MRLLLSVALLAVSGLGCALRAQDHPRPLSVTFVNPGKAGEVFWELVSDSMRAAGRSLGVEVETLWAERSFRRMQELGIEVVRRPRKPDFLIIVNEEAAGAPILEAAEAAGVKTLMLSNTLTGEDAARLGEPRQKLKTWIGSLVPDIEEAGARMARALVDAARANGLRSADGKIHLLGLAGDENTPLSLARNSGLLRVVFGEPDVVLDRLLNANWNETEGGLLADNYLQWAQRKGIVPAGIWAANDPIALGALKAARRLGHMPGRDIFIAGLNWSPPALDAVRQGDLLLTDGGHFLGGALSILLLRDYADGCDFAGPTPIRTFKTSAVTRERAEVMRAFVAGRQFERLDLARLRSRTGAACASRDLSVDALLSALSIAGDG
ncbi:MAG: ABC transporter substrate-binding protein [Hyphomicrobiaceae bacterium]|nr:ABC transporter substrate-binding protein [Hyphomicrobiaceae bacterium]